MNQVINPTTGLTPDEQRVHDSLMQAYLAFMQLPVYHSCELGEFFAGIHKLQGLLALRIASRLYPGGWSRDADDTSDGAGKGDDQSGGSDG